MWWQLRVPRQGKKKKLNDIRIHDRGQKLKMILKIMWWQLGMARQGLKHALIDAETRLLRFCEVPSTTLYPIPYTTLYTSLYHPIPPYTTLHPIHISLIDAENRLLSFCEVPTQCHILPYTTRYPIHFF